MKNLKIVIPGSETLKAETIPVRKTAGAGKLNLHDLGQGAITAAIFAGLGIIQQSLSVGMMKIDWKNVGLISIGAAVAYLLKNMTQGEKVIIKAKELTPPE